VGQDAVQEVRATDSATKKKSPRFTKSDHEALADIFKKIGQKELTKVSWSSDRLAVITAILCLVLKIVCFRRGRIYYSGTLNFSRKLVR
jgi:hypothetical protein